MLSEHFSAVLIVNYQDDFIMDLSKGGVEEVPAYFKSLMELNKEANDSGLRVFCTHFNEIDQHYQKHLNWPGMTSPPRLITKVVDDKNIYGKNGYTLPERLVERLASVAFNSEKPILVVGMDTDACVLQACFTLWEKKVEFKVSKAHVRSQSREGNAAALHIMDKNFRCVIANAMTLPGQKLAEVKKKDSIDQVLSDLWDYVGRIMIRIGKKIFG